MKINKKIFSWALYDWANSAFATTIMAGFFPLFFKQYWSAGVNSTESTFHLGVGNSIAAILVVVSAPVLGAIADHSRTLKPKLILFASVGVLFTAALALIGKGDWQWAILCYCVATVGFMGANVFYDAMVVSVVDDEHRNFVSALGYAMGYLGGGVLFAINVGMTLAPEFFGLDSAEQAVKASFISVAVWWVVFSLPLIRYVHQPKTAVVIPMREAVRAGFVRVSRTIHTLRGLREVWVFLLAYWFYIDGVDTIVRMAVDYGLALGLHQNDLIIALLIAQFVGFPATLAYGWMGQRIGARAGLYIGIVSYALVTGWAYFIDSPWEFYTMAAAIGLVQGGVQALSRSFYASLIPRGREGEFFGFYNMMGKSAAVLGPLLVGTVSVLSGSHRAGMLSVIVLFVVGGALLLSVKTKADKPDVVD